MTIIDSQVHSYEANTPKRPWRNVPNWPDHVTGDEMVAAMDRVGVDGAIFISAFRIMMTKELGRERPPTDPGLDRILRAAVRYDLPVNILCWGNLDAGAALVDRHPDVRFIIDHLGI